jgi:hypothetical protein
LIKESDLEKKNMFLPNEYEDLKIGGIYNKGGILVFQGKFS